MSAIFGVKISMVILDNALPPHLDTSKSTSTLFISPQQN
jgi:hypothetical protein